MTQDDLKHVVSLNVPQETGGLLELLDLKTNEGVQLLYVSNGAGTSNMIVA